MFRVFFLYCQQEVLLLTYDKLAYDEEYVICNGGRDGWFREFKYDRM